MYRYILARLYWVRKMVISLHYGDQYWMIEVQPSWVFIGRTDSEAETPVFLATSCEELTHWKRLWCWEGLGAGGEGDDRGWDGWMVSLTRWTWVWVNSRSWWWTGRPGMLRFMGSQSRTRPSDWSDLIWPLFNSQILFFLYFKLERINLWTSLTIIISKCNLIPEETYKWIRLIK